MTLPLPSHRLPTLVCIAGLAVASCSRGTVVPPLPLSATATFAAYSTPTLLPVTPAAEREAVLSETENIVEAREADSLDWIAASAPRELFEGNQVRTGDASRARIDFTEGTVLRLAANSALTIQTVNADPANPVTRLFFDAGKLFVVLGNLLGQEGYLDVETPVGVASVRGSLMSLEMLDGALLAVCFSGSCQAGTDDGIVAFGDGEAVTLDDDGLSDPAPAPPDSILDWQDEFGNGLPELLATETALKERAITATAAFFATATQAAAQSGDDDGDGWSKESGDCDDTDSRVFPLAFDEPGDDLDLNCDGVDGERPDQDKDGWSVARGDCNDLDPRSFPFAPDVTGDGVDHNCDGNDGTAPDKDGDGWTIREGDCDDTDPRVHPRAIDEPGDKVDRNCDGVDGDQDDADGDGFPVGRDCDDNDPFVNPSATEVPGDRKDNDCDGATDEVDATATPTRVFDCRTYIKGCPTPTAEPMQPTSTATPGCTLFSTILNCPTPTPTPRLTSTPTPRDESSKTPTATPTSGCLTLTGLFVCSPTPSATSHVEPTKTPTGTPTLECQKLTTLLGCTATPTGTSRVVPSNTPTATAAIGCLSLTGLIICTPTPTPTLSAIVRLVVTPTPTLTPSPTPTPTPVPDDDGDGYNAERDCNDADPAINPGARESLRTLYDDNCNDSLLN